jgi:hypothetical protein
VRPSYGRPRGHRPIVRLSVRKRPRDNPEHRGSITSFGFQPLLPIQPILSIGHITQEPLLRTRSY